MLSARVERQGRRHGGGSDSLGLCGKRPAGGWATGSGTAPDARLVQRRARATLVPQVADGAMAKFFNMLAHYTLQLILAGRNDEA